MPRQLPRLSPRFGLESDLSAAEKRAFVQQVLESASFANAGTLKAFLQYISDHAIAGNLDEIKEQQIGWRVLGRKRDYDPATDNIVRVRARQLRQKLEDYFLGEGADSPYVITIPKGGYIPVIERRPFTATATTTDSQPLLQTAVTPALGQSFDRLWKRFPGVLIFSGIALIAIVIPLFFIMKPHVKSEEGVPEIVRTLWAPLLSGPDRQVTVIFADAGYGLFQDYTHRSLSLNDYLGHRFQLERDAPPEVREIAVRRHTSLADLMLAVRFTELTHAMGGRVRFQYARNVDIQEMKSANVVIIGSRHSNPWVELYEPRMNFVLDEHPTDAGTTAFRPRSVNSGEPKLYALASRFAVEGAEGHPTQSYAVVASLPNLGGAGHVLIVEGLNMEATEAAGDFVTDGEQLSRLSRRAHWPGDKPAAHFEAVLKMNSVAGAYEASEVVAYRGAGR